MPEVCAQVVRAATRRPTPARPTPPPPFLPPPPPALQPGPAAPDALLTATADRQQHLAGYAPVVKCPSGQWPTCYDPADGAFTSGSGGTARGGLRPLLRQLVRCLPGGTAARLERALGLAEAASCGAPVAWHPQQPLLAAVDAGGRVQVFDYAGRVPALLGAGGGAGGPAPQALAPSALLAHELQHAPAALAWRPHGGKCLAVGAAQGVCLWHLGRPPPGSGSRQAVGEDERGRGGERCSGVSARAPGTAHRCHHPASLA